MNTEKISLARLVPNQDNPRKITDENFKLLIRSILSFPSMLELRPIIIDQQMNILGGNMRTLPFSISRTSTTGRHARNSTKRQTLRTQSATASPHTGSTGERTRPSPPYSPRSLQSSSSASSSSRIIHPSDIGTPSVSYRNGKTFRLPIGDSPHGTPRQPRKQTKTPHKTL